MYFIYLLINEWRTRTYTGFTNDWEQRKHDHSSKKVKTTKSFGNFEMHQLDTAETLEEAVKKEKYWKSAAGRRKIKKMFFS